MKQLLYDIDLKPGETGFTIRHGRCAYDLFEFGEKVQLYNYNNYDNPIIGEAEILFMFIEIYKNIDKSLLKDIKYPGYYEEEDIVTIIFYKRLTKGEALWVKLLNFLKTFFHLNQ